MTDRKNQLPAGWEIKKLREVADYFIGLTYSPKDVSNKGTIVLRSSNIQNDKLDFSDIIRVNRPIKENLKVQAGDILMCSRNGSKRLVGKTATIENLKEDMTFGTFMTIIRSQYNQYLSWFFKSDEFRNQINSGENPMINQITKYMLNDLCIPLPPLPEQKRIVAVLDKAFAAIARAKENAEKNLANARELFESYLQGVFANSVEGWEEKKLGEVSKITDGTHFSPKSTSKGEYMYITAKNIKRNYIDLTKITYLTEKDHREIYQRCPVKKGDVLYIKDGATAGIAALNTIEEEFSLLSSVAVFKPLECLLNTFLVYYMNSKIGRKNFLGYVDGAAITRLTLIKLKNVNIPLPPLPEQKRIVSKLDALSAETKKLEAIYQQKLADLDELKKSILQKAFAGEL